MNIELHRIPIREIAEGYTDNEEGGVIGYGGRLNIRPPFQREFIYSEPQQKAVITTILQGFPLNVMYWVRNDSGGFEMLDGQQRTISICLYVNNKFSVPIGQKKDLKAFGNLQTPQQEQIRNYELMIYICDGDDQEKIDWFETINIAGEQLNPQERRNAIYSGPWITDAKRYFCRKNCVAEKYSGYLKGTLNRQDYLETVIKWLVHRDGIKAKKDEDPIASYMNIHSKDKDSREMLLYFQNVMNWVQYLFPNYRKNMQRVEWGVLYNLYGDKKDLTPEEMEALVSRLMADEDVGSKAGIYEYVFDGDERHLNIRKFPDKYKRAAYERQKGICAHCGKHYDYEEMEADHITPWSQGGHTEPDNCQVLCRACNRKKGGK